jgi:tripartite-type tricarboxylate transporter receptor subunit TctC
MRTINLINKLSVGLAIFIASLNISAQGYPNKPITVIIPFSAGSASDVVTRVLLDKVATNNNMRFVFDNRPVAGGNVGTAAVVKADPDGYTIGMSTSGPLAVNKILNPDLGYDPERDLQPIALFAVLPNVIVVSSTLNINNLAQLNDYIRKTPDVGYGSVGNGSSQHLAGAYYEQLLGAKMTHVPYRVTANMVTDLVAGRVPISFQLLPNVSSQINGGRVKAIAVASNRRLSALPDVPTAAEAGIKGYESAAWFALIAPKGTSRAIIDKLNKDVNQALADPGVRAKFAELGADPVSGPPEDLTQLMASDIRKWTAIIKKGGITLDKQ